MNRFFNIVGVHVLCISSFSCTLNSVGHKSIRYENNSKEVVCFSTYFGYPKPVFDCPWGFRTLPANSHYEFRKHSGNFETLISNLGKLQIYIVSGEFCKMEKCQLVRDQQLWIERYELNVDDLDKLNWKIVYEGTK